MRDRTKAGEKQEMRKELGRRFRKGGKCQGGRRRRRRGRENTPWPPPIHFEGIKVEESTWGEYLLPFSVNNLFISRSTVQGFKNFEPLLTSFTFHHRKKLPLFKVVIFPSKLLSLMFQPPYFNRDTGDAGQIIYLTLAIYRTVLRHSSVSSKLF